VKLAAVLQTSALGGPTLSTRIEVPVDIRYIDTFAPGLAVETEQDAAKIPLTSDLNVSS
jgi:hypothetical protein